MRLAEKLQHIQIKEIMKASKTWNGGPLGDSFGREREVSMIRITLRPGERLPMHSHPVISVDYILSGELTVISNEGEQKVFREGEGFLGLVNQNHYGVNKGLSDTEILAVYFGVIGQSVTRIADDAILEKLSNGHALK